MAISVVQVKGAAWTGFTSLTRVFDSAPTNGNLILDFLVLGDPTGLTFPSGFTQIGTTFNDGSSNYRVADKRLVSGDSATQVWSWTNSSGTAGACSIELAGIDPTTPLEVIVDWAAASGGGTGPWTVASMTTLSNNAWDLLFVVDQAQNGDYTVNTGGYTEQLDDANGIGAIYSKLIATAGATGTRSFNVPAGFNCNVFNVSVKAAVAAGTAALSGTAIGGITEADVVAGGKTIIVTLTGDTFITD